MTKAIYVGVSDIAKKVKSIYVGVGGIAKKVRKVYVGDVNGVARKCFSDNSEWWTGNGLIAKSYVLGAYLMKGADSEISAKTSLYGSNILTNVGSPTWSSANGLMIVHSDNKGSGNLGWSNNTVNTNAKSCVIKYSGVSSNTTVTDNTCYPFVQLSVPQTAKVLMARAGGMKMGGDAKGYYYSVFQPGFSNEPSGTNSKSYHWAGGINAPMTNGILGWNIDNNQLFAQGSFQTMTRQSLSTYGKICSSTVVTLGHSIYGDTGLRHHGSVNIESAVFFSRALTLNEFIAVSNAMAEL